MEGGTITIMGYLTEQKLSRVLQDITGGSWRGSQVRLPGSRRTCDMAFSVGSLVTIVEYDGDEHYRNTLKVQADLAKDEIVHGLGWPLVRFPYWIQLDSATLKHFFNLDATICQSFPHGFISTRIFPASFCEMGIARFLRELDALPPDVRDAVLGSLKDRCVEHGLDYVLPTGLRGLV